MSIGKTGAAVAAMEMEANTAAVASANGAGRNRIEDAELRFLTAIS